MTSTRLVFGNSLHLETGPSRSWNPSHAFAKSNCEFLRRLSLPGVTAKVASRDAHETDVPALCSVLGVISQRRQICRKTSPPSGDPMNDQPDYMNKSEEASEKRRSPEDEVSARHVGTIFCDMGWMGLGFKRLFAAHAFELPKHACNTTLPMQHSQILFYSG